MLTRARKRQLEEFETDCQERGLKRFCIVKPSKIHGMGVFATTDIKKGQIVEECCVLRIPWKCIEDSVLLHYVFNGNDDENVSLVLGDGSIYNHSSKPNVEPVWYQEEESYVCYCALRNIKKGEELFIDYGEEYWNYRSDLKCKTI